MVNEQLADRRLFRRDNEAMAVERRRAAAQLLEQGLVVVPYRSPWAIDCKKPGKQPFSDPARHAREGKWRAECHTVAEFEPFLAREPDLNIAVLGVAQVDCDDARAQAWAREYGVSRSQSAWFIRTRRGWRAVYRPPAGAEGLVDRTKAGCYCQDLADETQRAVCAYHSRFPQDRGRLELDLLVVVPCIVPPSIHPSKVSYQWANGHSPSDIPFGELDEPPALVVDFWQNITKPKAEYPYRQFPQGHGFEAALKAALRPEMGQFKPEDKDGWIDRIHCPFPSHQDEDPSFSVNFRWGAWKCWSMCGTGGLRRLAEQLNVPVPTLWRLPGGGRAIHMPLYREV